MPNRDTLLTLNDRITKLDAEIQRLEGDLLDAGWSEEGEIKGTLKLRTSELKALQKRRHKLRKEAGLSAFTSGSTRRDTTWPY